MAWTNYQKFLAVLMVVTGSVNTIATKWADKLQSKNSEGKVVEFNHPFLQASIPCEIYFENSNAFTCI
ncbi:UNVERIFIED_CONTAM: Solute carrier family 35 member F6 [Trichonephila clavipes]